MTTPRHIPTSLALVLAVLATACSVGSKSNGGSGSPMGSSPGTAGVASIPPVTGTAGSGSGQGTAGSEATMVTGSAGSGTSTGSGGGGGLSAIDAGATDASTDAGGIVGAGGGGGTGSGSAGSTGTAGTGASQCVISIVPLTDLEAGSTLRLQASVSGFTGTLDGGSVHWSWMVQMAGASALANLTWTPTDDSQSTIDIPIATPGSILAQASIDGARGCVHPSLTFTIKPARARSFLFRVTPPSGTQLPIRETVVKAAAITDTPQTLALGDGNSEVVTFLPTDHGGFPIASYIRITSTSFAFNLEGYTGRGALVTPLATGITYDLLVIPDGALAPLLVKGTTEEIASHMSLLPGASVTGALRDGDGKPVAGARVLLRNGTRPSTIGESGPDGSFTLSTREGALAADILPPDGSGLPETHVTSGIDLSPSMTSLELAMDWAKVPAAALSVSVGTPGTGLPAVGARVRVELATPLSNAGTLTIRGSGAAPLTATGTARAEAVTDAKGLAHLGLLPTGKYHVIVAPPAGMPSAAITLADITLPAAGAAPSIALAAPVTLTGTLSPVAATPGTKVTAIDRGLLAAATLPTATVSASGEYSLSLAAGRSYELLVEPNPAMGLARAVVDVVTPKAGGLTRDYNVPHALLWAGVVTGSGRVVGGALVQVFCYAPNSSCLDPTLVLASGTTTADGTLTLALPAPSTSPPP